MDVRTRLIVAVAIAAMVTLGVGVFLTQRAHEQSTFQRDDTPLLAADDMGLTSAYKTLKDAGRKVAIDRAETGPKLPYAWWIVQPHLEWFTQDHARVVRRFVEDGGVAVLLPEESVIQIGEQEPQEELDGFFKALDLDLQIVAFDPPEEEEDAEEVEDDPTPPSVTLPTSGKGDAFQAIAELQTSWGNYFDGESLLRAEIRVHSDGFPLVAEFTLGKGRLVVVAESTYFENEFLDRSNNRSLLLALADSYGKDGIVLHPPDDASE